VRERVVAASGLAALTRCCGATIIMVAVARKQSFSLIFDPEVEQHLRAIDAKYHSLIRTKIQEQLLFDPDTKTRNRKPWSYEDRFDC
jgi:hypothetical protein